LRAQGEAAQGPGESGYQVGDHEDVVPVVGVGRRNVGPSTTGQRPEDANTSDEFGQRRVCSSSQDVPETYQCHTWSCSGLVGVVGPSVSDLTGCEGDEEHEDRALRVAVANGRRHRGKPFLRIALCIVRTDWQTEYRQTDVVLILDNLVVV
jgi:hypothetical protein